MKRRGAGLGWGGAAGAAGAEDAAAVEQKAKTAFALGRFADAATSFEKAYELKPEQALLYNAAQAHRLPGNKERALGLYENYARVYGKRDKREEITTRIAELKQAIEHDKAVSTAPPTGTDPSGGAAGVSPPPPPPPLVSKATSEPSGGMPAAREPKDSSSEPLLVDVRQRHDDDDSLMKKP